jgi:histidinol-phosphate aminotransferase
MVRMKVRMISPNAFLANLPYYEPGRPIEEVARELGLDPTQIIKLASNENPLGPSPKAREALHKALSSIHLYPDGNGYYLRKGLAEKHQLKIDQVVLGNGSNEIIEFLGHAFLSPGDDVIISQYAFAIYEIVAKTFQANVVEVPAKKYGHDLDAMRKAITPRTRLIFVANPNNPTGTVVSSADLVSFIKQIPDSVVVVLDEAYQEFLEDVLDTTQVIKLHPNVVVMRTFSKAQGLAGLRIGYGISSPEVVAALQKVRQPFQANSLAQAAALAALSDHDHIAKTVEVVKQGRKFLEDAFTKRGLEWVPSAANFVLVKVGKGQEVFQKLLQRGIIVRPMHGYKLPEWIRVTVGTAEENNQFIQALDGVLKK